jgi:hypothetical protein
MNTRNLLIAALAAVSLPVVGLTGAMLSTAAQADDNLWEHHREHCDALDHEEHDVRDRMVHTADPAEREHLDHRLHEIAEDRDLHCHR